jgi:hypothetical protein
MQSEPLNQQRFQQLHQQAAETLLQHKLEHLDHLQSNDKYTV